MRTIVTIGAALLVPRQGMGRQSRPRLRTIYLVTELGKVRLPSLSWIRKGDRFSFDNQEEVFTAIDNPRWHDDAQSWGVTISSEEMV